MKMQHSREIDEVVAHLQRMMGSNPPLWLRKALGYGVRNADYLIEREA
ncbi:hypothetical protein ACFS3C_00850 [Azotobacter vinelandii]